MLFTFLRRRERHRQQVPVVSYIEVVRACRGTRGSSMAPLSAAKPGFLVRGAVFATTLRACLACCALTLRRVRRARWWGG